MTSGKPRAPLKKQTAFRLDPEILEGLLFVKDRDGVPLSEQVRRALRAWLEQKGVHVEKSAPRRVSARRKA